MPAVDDEDRIPLGVPPGLADDEYDNDEPDLGPDERDRDLMDGSWEERYYAGTTQNRDWGFVQLAIAVVVVLGLVVPAILVLVR
jgi:hypothetical protein